jgi:hypothetical protein
VTGLSGFSVVVSVVIVRLSVLVPHSWRSPLNIDPPTLHPQQWQYRWRGLPGIADTQGVRSRNDADTPHLSGFRSTFPALGQANKQKHLTPRR